MFWPRFEYGGLLRPLREMGRVERDIDHLFSRFTRPYFEERPAINVWTNDEDIVITAEIPGINTNNIDISVTGNNLTLIVNRPEPEQKTDIIYHRNERVFGHFSRIIKLPFKADAEKVEAKYENGILFVKIPRAEEEKPKKIEIKSE